MGTSRMTLQAGRWRSRWHPLGPQAGSATLPSYAWLLDITAGALLLATEKVCKLLLGTTIPY